MTDQESKQTHVSAAADTFGELEQAHENLKAVYDRLHRQIGDCVEAGVGKHAEGVQIRNDIEDAKGRNASALAKLLKTHSHCTKIAVREGCDVPPALAIDGGLVRPLEGGR